MKKFFFLSCFIMVMSIIGPQTQAIEYEIATVTTVNREEEEINKTIGNVVSIHETLEVQRLNGESVQVETGDIFEKSALHGFKPGEKIILAQNESGAFFFADRYRVTPLLTLFAIFCAGVIFFARKKGLYAIIGLFITIGVIFFILIPGITHNVSTFFLALGSTALIGIGAMGLSHGFNTISRISLGSILVTLVFASLLSAIASSVSWVFGLGSEESWEIGTGVLQGIDFQGVFFIGVLLGALGVLDDVTITQVSAVAEIKKSNPSFGEKELFTRAIRIGKDHLVSVINTLVLAYSASSLPVFLLLSSTQTPWWVLLNSELIAEEIIRTLVGSSALILAIPLSTYWAAKYFARIEQEDLKKISSCGHHH